MALGGCYNCLKYLMFVFNFIFWLVGCALLAVGIWVKVDERSFMKVIEDPGVAGHVSVTAWVVIIIGSTIMVLGFLGCCGAIRESQCMLATFFTTLFIIFAALLAVGIYVYMNFKQDPAQLKEALSKPLRDCVRDYNNVTSCRERLDLLHKDLNCCGAEKGDMSTQHGISKAAEACGATFAIQEGCADALFNYTQKTMTNYSVIFVAIAFGIATIMLLGMIFAMLLCCAIREAMD